MAVPDLWNETFEGTGFVETWSRGLTDADKGSSTIDEDALSSAVSNPLGWGTNCFKCTVAAGGDVIYYAHAPTWAGSIYFRMEVVVTAESFNNNEFATIFSCWDSGFALGVFSVRIYQRSTGNLNFQVSINKDGTVTAQNSESGAAGTIISLNQPYRVEIQYDITNDLWEWRVNGNTEYSGALTNADPGVTDHPTDISEIRTGINQSNRPCTFYIDLIGFDNNDWIGEGPVTDNLFVDDSFSSALAMAIPPELVLLSDTGVRVREAISTVSENFFISDETLPVFREVAEFVSDLFVFHEFGQTDHQLQEQPSIPVYLRDQRLIDFLKTIFDPTLLSDARRQISEHGHIDSLLLASIVRAGRTRIREIIDGLLLNAFRRNEVDKLASEGLLIKGGRASDLKKQVPEDVLIGDSFDRFSVRGQQSSDGLFLNDFQRREVDRQILDLLLVSDELLRTKVRVVIDGLFLRDDRYNEVEKLLLDLILLDENARREQLTVVTEGLFLTEFLRSEVEKQVLDLILLGETETKDNLKKITEGLFLKDDRYNELEKQVLDLLFLDEETLRAKIRAVTDGLFIKEDRYSDLKKLLVDGLFLVDIATPIITLTTGVELTITDVLLTLEAAHSEEQKLGELLYIGDELREKAQARKYDDNLLLNTTLFKLLEKIVLEGVLLKDDRLALINRLKLDEILLGESLIDLAELRTRLATDGAFLNDFRTAIVELLKADGVFIKDTIAEKLFENLVRDNVFLKDIITREAEFIQVDSVLIKSIFTDIIELIAGDKLLLKDDRFSEVEKNFIAFLLVGDAARKEIQHIEGDTLLLKDSTGQFIIELQAAVDSLFLGSTDLRDQLHNFTDNVMFKDVIQSFVRDKTFTDPVLFRDDRLSEIELFQQNQVLFSELIISAKNAEEASDGLLLADTTTTLVVRLAGTILVYALLGARDLLGIKTCENEDFMLFNLLRSYNPAFLGAILGAQVEDTYFDDDF